MGYADDGYDDGHRYRDDYDADRHFRGPAKRRRVSFEAVSLRLIKKDSSRSPLPPEQTLAILSPSQQTSIGRDRGFDVRIRLKELAVSKTHAMLFWLDGDRDHPASWAITDVGSQHGTFIQRVDTEEWQRLSEPKMASKPWRIGHLDRIKICSTTFTAHVHTPPCDLCAVASDDSNLIPTSAQPETAPAPAVVEQPFQPASRESKEETIKRDMKDLRTQLMAKPRSAPKEVDAPAIEYVDRAKLRRALHGSSVKSSAKPTFSRPLPAAKVQPPSVEDSKGYELLSKLSGPLGKAEDLAQPVEARTLGDGRAGLGSRELLDGQSFAAERQPGGGYESARRRWDSFQSRATK